MIPVQQEFANATKHWNMPFPSLLARLDERTAGRVIRADRGKAELEAVAQTRQGELGQLGQTEWQSFLGALTLFAPPNSPRQFDCRRGGILASLGVIVVAAAALMLRHG